MDAHTVMKTECEGELLPGYTDRATGFEKAIGMSAAYSVYSGPSTLSCMRSNRPGDVRVGS